VLREALGPRSDLPRSPRSSAASASSFFPPAEWPILKKHGLTCAIASSHGFEKGLQQSRATGRCASRKLRTAIDASADFGCPNVITFTGFRDGIPTTWGRRTASKVSSRSCRNAERKKVTLCPRDANSRVDETMKGHPGYQGDHTDLLLDIINKVGSPRLKLLFDIYHGADHGWRRDHRRLRHTRNTIGPLPHGGKPGAGASSMTSRKSTTYPPIMEEIVKSGYTGCVGSGNSIPTRDPLDGLTQSVRVCDV